MSFIPSQTRHSLARQTVQSDVLGNQSMAHVPQELVIRGLRAEVTRLSRELAELQDIVANQCVLQGSNGALSLPTPWEFSVEIGGNYLGLDGYAFQVDCGQASLSMEGSSGLVNGTGGSMSLERLSCRSVTTQTLAVNGSGNSALQVTGGLQAGALTADRVTFGSVEASFVKADTVKAQSVIAEKVEGKSYSPGAGNIW